MISFIKLLEQKIEDCKRRISAFELVIDEIKRESAMPETRTATMEETMRILQPEEEKKSIIAKADSLKKLPSRKKVSEKNDEKFKKYQRITDRLFRGEKLRKACSAEGITDATFYNWRRKYENKTEPVSVQPEDGYGTTLTDRRIDEIRSLRDTNLDAMDISAKLGLPFEQVFEVLQ